MCQSMVNIQSPAAEIRRGKKRKKKKEEGTNHSMKMYVVSLLHRATINKPDSITVVVSTRLDKFWSNKDVLYNFKAPFLGTGSRSFVFTLACQQINHGSFSSTHVYSINI